MEIREKTMSRGLGKMQRLILASLRPAKQAYIEGKFNYVGAARFANLAHLSDLYDLRATLPYLAIRLSERPSKRKRPPISEDFRVVDQTFRVAFCQAAHTLVERGLLIPCDDEDAKQLRFVSMRPDIFAVHPQIRLKIPAPELTRMLRVLLENSTDAENAAAEQLHAVVGLLAASGLTYELPH